MTVTASSATASSSSSDAIASAAASSPISVAFDATWLDAANAQLADATPQQILRYAVQNLPNLYQTTAFGLTGLAATDMLYRLSRKQPELPKVPLIFIDTLYHFQETLDLLDQVAAKYNTRVKVYTPPDVATTAEFEAKYGEKLWETDEDTYDYLVKVEPARRAYAELGVKAVITGRRRSQGADRATLQPLEIDSTGLIKVNPLCRWSFDDVKDYIDMAGVPYNVLLDRGYKSVGDWHSTQVPKEGEDERGGRWADKGTKTECGLHKDYFKMKKAYEKKRRETELALVDKARGENSVGESSVQLGLLSLSEDAPTAPKS